MPIPRFRAAAAFAVSAQRLRDTGTNCLRVGADQGVGALGEGDRAFGVLAQGNAGYAERGGFFLHAAGVGEDDCRVAHHAEHLEIADGRQGEDLRIVEEVAESCRLDFLPGARVYGENDGEVAADSGQRIEEAFERGGVVDVGGAMQGEDGVAGGGLEEGGRILGGRCFRCDGRHWIQAFAGMTRCGRFDRMNSIAAEAAPTGVCYGLRKRCGRDFSPDARPCRAGGIAAEAAPTGCGGFDGGAGGHGAGAAGEEGVDHDVTGEDHLVGVDTFCTQVVEGVGFGRVKAVG